MTRLIIDTGTLGNPATGDTLRTAMTKVNDNFLEVYTDLAASGLGGQLTNETTNGNVIIQPNGTGIVEVDQLLITDDQITSLITNNDLTLSGNGTGGVTVLGNLTAGQLTTNEIVSQGSNADVSIEPSGTGDILLKTDGQVGIGSVGSPDTSLHIKQATATITLQRTNDANTPGIDFQNSGGNVRAKLFMDGTDGVSKELIFKVMDDSSLDERFRVTRSGANVTGTFLLKDDSDSSLGDATISMTENRITTLRSNDNLEISANGTGAVKVDAILSLPDGSATDNYVGVGDDDDLKIFHNGSHSIIRETGTGSLFIQSDNNVILGKDSGSETMIKGIADGAVELYHDNSKKFETTSGGVSVTGNLAADGSQIDFTNLPTSDPGVAGRLYRDGTTVKISV
jgi:hypothetical protein